MTDTQFRLGQILPPEDTTRDAVHVAVIPVTAACLMDSGAKVVLLPDGRGVHTTRDNWIGVVDPFLNDVVRTGERFWLFLRPNTIHNLVHAWNHPAFDRSDRKDDPKQEEIETSRKWLEKFCRDRYGFTADEFIGRILQDEDHPWGGMFGDQIVNGQYGWDEQDKIGSEEIDQFWSHFQIVTGRSSEHIGTLPRQCCV